MAWCAAGRVVAATDAGLTPDAEHLPERRTRAQVSIGKGQRGLIAGPPRTGMDDVINPLSPVEAMELLIDKLNKTKSNAEFLAATAEDGVAARFPRADSRFCVQDAGFST